MMISVPAGYQLTTDGRIVPGGPINLVVGAGLSLTTDGRLVDVGPRWEPTYVSGTSR